MGKSFFFLQKIYLFISVLIIDHNFG